MQPRFVAFKLFRWLKTAKPNPYFAKSVRSKIFTAMQRAAFTTV